MTDPPRNSLSQDNRASLPKNADICKLVAFKNRKRHIMWKH